MSTSDRYYNRAIRTNSSDTYDKIVKEMRGLPKGILQFTSAEFDYPTEDEILNLTVVTHTWRLHDKFYKLAHEHYGDSRLWWAIAWFNKTPTESQMRVGDVVHIAHPLDALLPYFGL